MATLPAARMGFSETQNLEFETQKNERETLLVHRESLSQERKSRTSEAAPQARRAGKDKKAAHSRGGPLPSVVLIRADLAFCEPEGPGDIGPMQR